MKALAGALLALTVALPAAAQQGATQTADPKVIVDKAARNYKSLTSLQADIRMRIVDATIGDEEWRGTMAQMGKDRFVMRFTSPPNHFYLIDGKDEWQYFPSATRDQVAKRPAPASAVYGSNYISWFLESPTDRYVLKYLRTETIGDEVTDVVQLDPVSRDMEFRRATVWFAREDGLPRRMDFDEVRAHRIIDLSRLRKNLPLPDSIFKFVKPPGARIVTP